MLIIREQQLSIFDRMATARFEDQLVSYIAAEYPIPYETMGESGARKLISTAIATGSSYGIKTEGSVGVLLELMIQFGEDFERAPERAWVKKMLSHPTLPGEVKVEVIRERLNQRADGRVVVAARKS